MRSLPADYIAKEIRVKHLIVQGKRRWMNTYAEPEADEDPEAEAKLEVLVVDLEPLIELVVELPPPPPSSPLPS
jgi:hypothetical protein